MNEAKKCYINALRARGLEPICDVIFPFPILGRYMRHIESAFIKEYAEQWPWLTNDGARGGAGVADNAKCFVYMLREPWPGGRVFYIGVSDDVESRHAAHLSEANEGVTLAIKNQNLARTLADFLEGCPKCGAVLKAHINEPIFRTFFFRSRKDYLVTWGRSNCFADDAIPVTKYFMHAFLSRQDFARIVTAFNKAGLFRQ